MTTETERARQRAKAAYYQKLAMKCSFPNCLCILDGKTGCPKVSAFLAKKAANSRSYRARKKRAFAARLEQQSEDVNAKLQEIFDNGN